MPCLPSKYCLRCVVDVTILLIVFLAIFLVKKLWPPFQRGMHCHDQSLRFPFKDQDTISDSVLLFYGVAVPFSVMCIIEYVRMKRENVGKDLGICGKGRFGSWLWCVYSTVGVFLFGCSASQLLTDIAKHSLGVLRPNFIDVCQPAWAQTNCSSEENQLSYIETIPCTTSHLERLEDARRSFPSAHASFSTFTMLYLTFYLQARLLVPRFRLLRPSLQLFCLALNLYTCLSRLADYQHHWFDVVGGILLGASVACFSAFFVSDLFTKKCPKIQKDSVLVLQEYHRQDNPAGCGGSNNHNSNP